MMKIYAIGFLGKDAVLKTLDSGSKVISFSIASTEVYKDKKGDKQEHTTWLNCSWFFNKDNSCKIIEFLKRGQQVFIEGFPSASSYINQNKDVIAELKIKINDLSLLGRPVSSNDNVTNDPQASYGN